jgi:hypothetical protein
MMGLQLLDILMVLQLVALERQEVALVDQIYFRFLMFHLLMDGKEE